MNAANSTLNAAEVVLFNIRSFCGFISMELKSVNCCDMWVKGGIEGQHVIQ